MDNETSTILKRIAVALEEHNRMLQEWRAEDEIRRLTVIQAQALKEWLDARIRSKEESTPESEVPPTP